MRMMPTGGDTVGRFVAGPLVTAAVGAGLLLFDHFVMWLPTSSGLTFLSVVYATYLGGTRSGLISAAIMYGYALIFLSERDHLLTYNHDGLLRLGGLMVLTPLMVMLVAAMRVRAGQALRQEQASRKQAERSNHELQTLRAALDQVEDGIVLLDREMRARFINRAFRNIWCFPDDAADHMPSLVELVRHGRSMRPTEIDLGAADDEAAERAVRAGVDIRDLRLKTGKVYRYRSKALPDGGAMLSYTEVTDLVQHADRLQELATVDGLTGIYNRRHFMTLAESEWGRFYRYDRRLSLLLIDIDHFKTVNDRFGHDAGDRVLTAVAQTCGDGKRGTDTLARLGGEEFALLLPETDIVSAIQSAERLRKAIAGCQTLDGPHAIAVTVSIGVAEADRATVDLAALIKRADDALYEAKRKGRDRVVAWGDPPVAAELPRRRAARAG